MYRYNAFISYSHAADGKLAPGIQKALHKFAKPWYRVRSIRTFRDETNLSITPSLWPSIVQALEHSEFFLFFASEESANSKWVLKEVQWWIEHRPLAKLLIIKTGGVIAWDDTGHDLDWTQTTAIPTLLKNKFASEPKYVDFSWAKKSENVDVRDARFLNNILLISSKLRDIEMDDLAGEDVRQHKRTRKVAVGALVIIFFSLLAAAWQRSAANQQRNLANKEANVSSAGKLANYAEFLVNENFRSVPLAVAFAGAALNRYSSAMIANIFWKSVEVLPKLKDSVNHSGVSQIRFSSDGKYVASAGTDGTARVTLLEDNALVAMIVHAKPVWDIAFSPMHSFVATASEDGKCIVYDYRRNVGVDTLYHSRTIRKVRFSPSGKYLGTGSEDGTATIYDLNSQKEVGKVHHTKTVWSIAFDPLERYFVSSSRDGNICIRDLRNGTEQFIEAHSNSIWEVAVSNQYVATASSDSSVALLDLETGQQLHRFPHNHEVTSVVFHPCENKLITSTWDGMINFWSLESKALLSTISTGNLVLTLSISSDGKLLGAGGNSSTLWNTVTLKEEYRLYKEETVYNIAFSNDGRWAASADSKAGRIWELVNNKRKVIEVTDRIPGLGYSFATNGWAVQCSADSKYLATGGPSGTAYLFDLHQPRLAKTFEPNDSIIDVAYHADKSLMVTSGLENIIRLFDAKSGKCVKILKVPSAASSVAFDPSGQHLAAGSDDGVVTIWNIPEKRKKARFRLGDRVDFVTFGADGQKIIALPISNEVAVIDIPSETVSTIATNGAVHSIQPTHGSEYLALSTKSSVLIIDMLNGTLLKKINIRNYANGVSATTDGRMLAVIEEQSNNVRIMRVMDGKVLNRLTFPSGVNSVAFDPSNNFLAAGCDDGSIHIFDLANNLEYYTAYWSKSDRIVALTFSPDGRFLIAGSENYKTSAWLWRTQDALELACSILPVTLTEDWKSHQVASEYIPFCNQ